MSKNIEELLLENNLEELGNILFKVSNYFNDKKDHHLEVLDDKKISKKFKKCKKNMLEIINELNEIKALNQIYREHTTGVKIGESITLSGQNNSDFDMGIRSGFVFLVNDGQYEGKTMQVLTFDKDKFAIFEGKLYLDNCTITRIS